MVTMLKFVYVALLAFACYKCMPILYNYTPYTMEALEKMATAVKNDTFELIRKHNLIDSWKKLLNDLDKRISDWNIERD